MCLEDKTEASVDGAIDVALVVEDACWRDGMDDIVLATEGDEGAGDPLLEVPRCGDAFRDELRECELRPRLAILETGEGTGTVARDTIFMPLLVLVLAGMNSVVLLSGPGMAIL